MKKTKVRLKEKVNNSYEIIIERGSLKNLDVIIKKFGLGKNFAIITDDNLEKIYGRSLKKHLQKKGLTVGMFSFKKGEKSKSLKTVEEIADKMVVSGVSRDYVVIALGGGVTGDLAGFIASVFMRGIPFIQIPTSLLAMVDSSVGGKTGVDLSSGKNLIGTFNQPKLVIIDPDLLKGLPKNQIESGMAEVIKYGIIKDESFFTYIEKNLEEIMKLKQPFIDHVIYKSVQIKKKVVQNDEKEKNNRMILNYGHTYGHALEKLSNYRLLHGYAISIGMNMINKIAVNKGILKKEEAERIRNLLKKTGLPTTTMLKVKKEDLLSDKKRKGDLLYLVLAKKIGKCILYPEKL